MLICHCIKLDLTSATCTPKVAPTTATCQLDPERGPQVPRGRTRHCHVDTCVGPTSGPHNWRGMLTWQWTPHTYVAVGPTVLTWQWAPTMLPWRWAPQCWRGSGPHNADVAVGPTGFSFLTFRIRQRLLRCISLNYYCITMRKQREFERCFITGKHCFMGLKQLAKMQRFWSVAFFKKGPVATENFP